jgi:hypothetical protein
VGHQEVHGLAPDPDRHVPVALGRQSQDVDLVRRVERRRDEVAGHVLPAEVLERPHVVRVDRVLGEDHQPELAREGAEAEGVVAAPDAAVVVEVLARRDAGVGRRDERVRVRDRRRAVLRDLEEVVAEQVGGGGGVVELVDQEHVGPRPLDHLGDVACLAAEHVVDLRMGEMVDEVALGGSVERRVERREADVVGLPVCLRGRRCEQQHRDQDHEHAPHCPLPPLSIARKS